MTLDIRFATAADLDTIHGFILALADYERLSHEVRADKAMLGRHLFGAKPMAEVLIAEEDGAPLGFALFFHNFSTFEGRPGLYLEDLFVAPEARGRGVGKALIVRLAGLALERDCARFEWWVLDWNQPAIDFYRSIGAKAMDEWTVQRVEGEALRALAARGDGTMADTDLIDWLAEELKPLGPLSHRPMMGGRTLYLDSTVFAIIAGGELWLKADATSDAVWDEAGCPRFTYEMGEGRTGTMNYRRAPDEVHDDAEALLRWAALALEAGRRGPARKR